MALSHRRESVGRTRFLLALSLSTVTALAVAAPLAIQAVNADQPTFVAGDPASGRGTDRSDDDLAISRDRSLATETEGGLGGIGTRPAAKGQGQTSKTESGDSGTTAPDPAPDSPVLTNPAPAPTDDPPVEPAETTTTIEATTTTEDPDPTTPTSEDTTTTTEDPDATTSTSDDTGSTTSTTDTTAPPETTTTSGPGATSSSNPVSLP